MRPSVLYVAGWARSGSTLLADLVGSVDGFVSVGELRDIWQVGMIEDQPCGCGERFTRCSFWREVLVVLHGGGVKPDPRRMVDLQQQHLRVRHAPRLIARRDRTIPASRELAEYADGMAALYAAIQDVAGASTVVDSSKYPSDGAMLRSVVDVAYVQLVRDPRAVAHSWRRVKIRRDRHDRVAMPRYGPVYSTVNWVAFNLLTEALRRGPEPDRLVRYEDLVRDPRQIVSGLLELTGRRSDVPIDDEGRADVVTSHSVNGNPGRLRSGPIRIVPDEEWRGSISPGDRRIATLIAAPLLSRYGYSIRVGRGS